MKNRRIKLFEEFQLGYKANEGIGNFSNTNNASSYEAWKKEAIAGLKHTNRVENPKEYYADFEHLFKKEFEGGEDAYGAQYAFNGRYAAEYRSMHSAIHHLIKVNNKADAMAIADILGEMQKTKDVEMEDFTTNLYSFEGAEDMEINFREIKEIDGNRYYDDDIFIVNKSVDVYL
jgi:hypothetical protein